MNFIHQVAAHYYCNSNITVTVPQQCCHRGIVKMHPSTIVLRYSRLIFILFISRHVSFELYITYTVSFTSTSVIVYEDGKQ